MLIVDVDIFFIFKGFFLTGLFFFFFGGIFSWYFSWNFGHFEDLTKYDAVFLVG